MFNVVLLILLSLIPLSALAIRAGEIPGADYIGIPDSPVRDVPGAVGILREIVKWIWTIFFVMAVTIFLFAAYTYLTAASNTTKLDTARKLLLYGAIAVVVAFMAVGAETIIANFLKEKSYAPTSSSPSYPPPSAESWEQSGVPPPPLSPGGTGQPIKGTEGPDIR